ncbi:hypothetical protein ABZY44_32535 [Streptomyces sp. NPDC006544]|uniref:hypothetical protein n=1 Tax=Streptomyces sp. NPDC006544 TaxID=3154583 RepID=UPI0033A19716
MRPDPVHLAFPTRPHRMDPRAVESIERIVAAVRDGDDAAIRILLPQLATVADTSALFHLREQLLTQ